MNIQKLTLKEYQDRKPKSYLEKCMEDGTAEYYIINYKENEYQFFFYKKPNNTAEICVEENSANSLFDYEDAMNKIFSFLQEKGYKKIKITLMDNLKTRKNLAIKYGFKEIQKFKQGDLLFIEYLKNL